MNAKWKRVLGVLTVADIAFVIIQYFVKNLVHQEARGSEIGWVRALAQSDDWETLARRLDDASITIPAGEFVMGSMTGRDDEHPPHGVYLDAFGIDRYEVTNVQYWRFVHATGVATPPHWSGKDFPSGQADYPIVGVSWDEADAYCKWLGKYLPTEAEWEKACRGSDARVYPWGNGWSANRANVDETRTRRTWDDAWALLRATNVTLSLKPIGWCPDGASPYGVMDLAGNASEWILDWYNWQDYSEAPDRNPIVTTPPWNHVVRGSAWFDLYGDATWAQQQSRCAARNSSHETRDPRTGFRCVRVSR